MKNHDDDFDKFTRELEQGLMVEEFRQHNYNSAADACKAFGILWEKYCNWFNNDQEFRVRIYMAVAERLRQERS